MGNVLEVLKRMTVWTKNNEVMFLIVLWVSVFVVYSQNSWLLCVPALFAGSNASRPAELIAPLRASAKERPVPRLASRGAPLLWILRARGIYEPKPTLEAGNLKGGHLSDSYAQSNTTARTKSASGGSSRATIVFRATIFAGLYRSFSRSRLTLLAGTEASSTAKSTNLPVGLEITLAMYANAGVFRHISTLYKSLKYCKSGRVWVVADA